MVGAATPSTLSSAVVNGIMITSSWSCPKPDCPLLVSTPMTSIGTPFTRMVAPTGSWYSPKRFFSTVCPSRATRAASRSSASDIGRPADTDQFLIGR